MPIIIPVAHSINYEGQRAEIAIFYGPDGRVEKTVRKQAGKPGLAHERYWKEEQGRADKGDANAQWNHAINYAMGPERIDYICRAAMQGQPVALYSLGRMRAEGDYFSDAPVTADSVRAYMWYTLSDEKAFAKAANYRNDLSKSMTPTEIAEGERLAAEWTPVRPCP
ncbi:MAG: hypothetical protein GY791_04615 [Alphaproteobacteria bacterium]|nr:hypothetical protein [Alphaproteobacteria bacterium]